MRETINFSAYKTVELKNGSFNGLDLNFKIKLNRTTAEMDALPQFLALSEDALSKISVTATLIGQTTKQIKIYNDLTLAQIIDQKTNSAKDYKTAIVGHKLMITNEKSFVDVPVRLPISTLNLSGNHLLKVEIKFNGFGFEERDANDNMDLDKSFIEVTPSHTLAVQHEVEIIDKIQVQDDRKKTYNFLQSASKIALTQAGDQPFDFVEGRVESDVFNEDVSLANAITNTQSNYSDNPTKSYLVLVNASQIPLNNAQIDLERRNQADSPMELLVTYNRVMTLVNNANKVQTIARRNQRVKALS
ncbi:hypothetical protein [Mesoflavibacter sp. SCSIO 43206]|uniref:hypothetical protein n=1 Tax=Mesoflavibacter sp. SCSIO 43206 TaxID=2779362 RepID=UPI001CA84167|nr:hypothetical protein [Mesoflavibacter sp. SCSIO 43206]UAB75150.1 hypothetical protein INR78_12270 [Mesoflavibacter sp. SCSIO 43206]